MYAVLVSAIFQRQFNALQKDTQQRIRAALKELEKNPFTSRSGADIKQLAGTKPPKHRIRVGDFRIVYAAEGKTNMVKVIEVFKRGRGYRE